ncbi:MAG: putative SOS response-associated peptidase YedK [Candidatus Nitrotoga sp. LAW]|nr:MAG: putative SOS response-associated peptidase YedK [Candidatus Nitrotoga sp. LAW]
MCGRFALKENPKKLGEYFQLTGDLEFLPSWNIAPSSRICSITADAEGNRHLHKMRWGLIPSWAKDDTIGNKLANARGETVAEKPSFRSAFKHRRCLIPASGFYEWKTENGIKYPWYVSLKSGSPLAFAGLWEIWHPEDGEPIESCCIITTAANSLMEPIHERMPVILNPDQWTTWLSPQEQQIVKQLQMIHPCDPDSLQVWPVTRELNRVGLRDDAGLVEPLPNIA